LTHGPHRHQRRGLRGDCLGASGQQRGLRGRVNERGERTVSLEEVWVNRLGAMREPGESYSDVILRIAGQEALATRRG
jgi:hypothetical protein